MQIEI